MFRKELQQAPESLFGSYGCPTEVWKDKPDVDLGYVASSNFLYRQKDGRLLSKIWRIDDQIRCADMESGGFGSACKGARTIQWISVRGISDFGTVGLNKDQLRMAAALSASTFLRMFLEEGLIECDPSRIKLKESDKTQLSTKQFYAQPQFDVILRIKSGIKEKLNLDLSGYNLGNSLSLADLESVCLSHGRKLEDIRPALVALREEYYTEKYKDYTYENDLRGIVQNWTSEIYKILQILSIDIKESTVLDVGIGNGLEAVYFLSNAKNLIGVDVSREMLATAKKKLPSAAFYVNPAEDLRDIPSSSIDLYISLRTYQSSMFDLQTAVREAQRVIKPKGRIIISIANGFVEEENGVKAVVRGLLIPGTRIVDKSTPDRLGQDLKAKLDEFGFKVVGYDFEGTDVYVWARRT